METYRERLTAPLAWWVVAVLFGVICGWIMVVATTRTLGIVAAILGTLAAAGLVKAYGGLTLQAGADGLRVGRAHLPTEFIGAVAPLDRVQFRASLGPEADARAWLSVRPYIDTGIRIDVSDPSDPVPYWLVSSRRPESVAAALGRPVRQTEPDQRGDQGEQET